MFEAYKIGVRLSLVNGVTAGLMTIVGQFRSLDNQLNNTNRKLSETDLLLAGIKRKMIIGGGMMATGLAGITILDKTIHAGREYAHQLSLMNSAGMKHLEIVKATAAAWDASKSVPTSSAAENLAAIRDLRMVFGDTGHAIEFMPAVQKAQAILQMYRHGEGGSSKAEAYQMAKALEMKGAVKSPQQFLEQADMMTRALVATGGKVGASDFLSAFKYGRSATSGWNDKFAYTILPTLIQEMKSAGGSGATGGPGNALMSAYAAVVGGAITQKALQVWQKLGLLDPTKVIWNKVGSAKGVGPGGIMGSADFQSNPYEWSQKFLVPALKRAGYQTEEQQKQALQYLFPNRTAGFVMSQFVTQGWKFERDKKLIGQAQGFDAYQQLLKNDPEMASLALHKQWQNLLSILGYQIMPALIKGTLWLINVFGSLSKWFYQHQGAAKALTYSLAALSGVLLVGGAGITLWAGFSLLGKALAFSGIGGARGIVGIASGVSRLAAGLGPLGIAITAILAALPFANDRIRDQSHGKVDGLADLYRLRFHNADGSFRPYGLFSTEGPNEAWARTHPKEAHVHINLDGKELVKHIIGLNNNTGATGMNTSLMRPPPATGLIGY